MNPVEKLLYLDRDYISGMYEIEKGVSPETKITKSEGLNAGVKIPLFSAAANTTESKVYTVSTNGMLTQLEDQLSKYPQFSTTEHEYGKPSLICWVEGKLTIEKVEVSKQRTTIIIIGKPSEQKEEDKKRLVAEEFYFSIHSDNDSFALIPTKDYFVSGVSTFQELSETVIGPIDLPVKALIRVYSAQTSFKQWIAVPLVILEP